MYDSSLMKEEIKLLIHKTLNLVEAVKPENCDCPRAKAIVITKLEEALLWMDYTGRSAPTENKLMEIKGRK